MNTEKKELQETEVTHVTRSQYFAMVLYPDENEIHKGVINYIAERPELFEYVLVIHEPEEEGKKKHVHLMYKLPVCSYPKSQLKFWAGMIDYIEPVRDYIAYARYMIHDSPSAITEGKKHYSIADVQGTDKFKQKLFGNKVILQNLDNILDLVHYTSGSMFLVLREVLSSCNSDSLLSALTQYQYLIVNAANQMYNFKY